MNFTEQLSEELKTALRSKDKVRLKVIRELKSRVRTWEINHRQAAGEADFIKLVQTAVKQRKEAIILFEKGGRPDLVASEQSELGLLEVYLPEMMSGAEIDQLVDEVLAETGVRTLPELGKVMSEVMRRAAGRADGRLVREFVRTKLQNG